MVIASIFLSAPGCSSLKTTNDVSTVSGGVATSVAGSVSPTVVLQSGLGDGKDSWRSVFNTIAESNRVFAYDRPGRGGSPSVEGPRDPCTVAAEMRRVLQAAGIAPPYILVGHSLGGLYQYAYAKLYPEEVVGLVLLDPTHPEHWSRMQHDAPAAAAVLKGFRMTVFNTTSRAEFDDQSRGLDRIDMTTPLNVPGRMLTRTRFPGIESGTFEKMVHSLENDWVRLLGDRCVKKAVAGSGHYIHQDRPDVVVAELRSLIAELPVHSK
jgi:pimeloyl-ACP methyl ester carboxylesterase